MIRTERRAAAAVSTRQECAAEIEITTHDVHLPYLPENLSGTTVLQLTDFHRGCGDTDGLIAEAITKANLLEPDYVVLTGDYVNDCNDDILPVVEMVSKLRARRGIFAIRGNHDHRADAAQVTAALESSGIPVLHNRSEELAPGLHIAGVDDLVEGDPDLMGTLSRLPRGEAVVFLCHNPNGIDFVPRDRALLMLSGHTHGGQIVLSFPSPQTICRWHLHTRYVAGWYSRGSSRLYVNRGIGVTGSRFLARRVNCPPEISRFRLLCDSAAT